MTTLRPLDIHRDWPWVREHIQCLLCEDTRGIVAERDGEIIGAMIADSWTENSCQVHNGVTDPMAFRCGLHVEFARYVFGDCGRKMMIGLTPSNLPKAIKINAHYGFTEFTRIPDAYADGVDYIVYRMTADECPYFGDDHGIQQKPASTAATAHAA